MKFKKKLWISLILFILFGTVFSGWIFHQNTTREYLVFDNTTQLETTERSEDNIRIEDVILPDSFQNQQSILFKTTHTRAEVLLDGEKIYEFGNDTDTLRFMKSPGSCWHIVDLPKNSDGKHLQVRIIPVYSDYYGNSFHIFGGTKGDCTLKILSNSLYALVISCEILSLGVVCLILCFSIIKKNNKYHSEESSMIFLSLGIFSLLITLWTVKQCGFLQFLIPDPRALYFIDYFTFFLFPVPFNFILYDICKSKYRKGAIHLSMLYLTNIAVAVLLQCTGIIDIFRILPVTHSIMLVNVIYTILLIRYETVKLQNEAASHFKYPMYLVMGFGVAELVAYYVRHFQQTSLFLPLGTMLFIILLIWIQISRFYDHYLQKEKLVYLLKLADTDLLTDTLNRNAYEKRVNLLDKQTDELYTTGLILFDLDNLKIINDQFGHEKGDEALQLCSQCIRQFFPDKENLFRIGGDEFAYFYHKNEENHIEDKIAQLNKNLEATEHTFDYPLSISAGYACFLPETDSTFKDLAKRSDLMLYRIKRKRKQKLKPTYVSPQENLTINTPSSPKNAVDEKQAEEIFNLTTDYQNLSPMELCNIINLLSPSTDGFLYILDFRTDFFYIAPQALDRFCLPGNEFHNMTKKLKEFVYKNDYPLLKAELDDLLNTNRSTHNMEYRWLDLNREPVWINCRGYIIRDDQQEPIYLIGCINEIGKRQKADNITGLLGETSLEKYFKNSVSTLDKGFLIHVGIDGFKMINENYGWDYGDYILRETASCILSCISDSQKVYKITSDEFIILDTTSSDMTTASRLYDHMCKHIDQFIEENNFAAVFTISAGILPLQDLSQTGYAEIIKRTDFSLTMAKQHGRNCCYIFQEEEYQNFLRIREISNELHSAVNHGFRGFSIIFQPIMDIRQDKLTGAEVLIRFASKKFGQISPAEFIPLLETSGLIIPTGRWFMREAITACRKIRMQIPDFKVNINVSQVQITKSDIITDLISEMDASGLPPAAIAIELTESILLEKNEKAQKFLKELKQAGLQLALDDFGTGYSNFHYLSELHPDIVKIDRGFTSKALTNKKEYYLLSQFSNMIHNLDLKLCIEGIETEDELQKMKLLKPDYCQGFYWGRPCSYDEFRKHFVDVDR